MHMLDQIRRLAAIFRAHALANQAWAFPPDIDDEDRNDDRLTFVREPKPVSPGGRLASVAVDEPYPETFVRAIGPHS